MYEDIVMMDQNPQRLEKILQMVANRQPDLTVFMEDIHKAHNLAAIVRTADAVGIGDVHAVFREGVRYRGHHISSGSKRWVKTHRYETLDKGLDTIKAEGMQLVCAHFSDRAVDFRTLDYTKPTCLLMGSELVGVSEIAADRADHHVVIPMLGMVQSLNVSVAAALILYEAQQQRIAKGMYGKSQWKQEDVDLLVFTTLYPTVKRYCDQHKIRYPRIDELGNIVDPEWDELRKLTPNSKK